ncbi:GGDEF domain-containing protein [Solicola sp. PLA-1-18]|uniref:GGDEF domain-containing protein n=1 Tax=Solicola sp. PLA-1-18 TaxID=3380532 RepID=UPI003B767936
MKSNATPEVATPSLMARTLATFYICGGVTGLLAAAGADGSSARRWLLVAMAAAAVAVGLALARWGTRFSRAQFHAVVLVATAMISAAAVVSPDPTTALLVAVIITFIAMDAFFFFPLHHGLAQLGTALLGVTSGLGARGDVAVAHIAGLDVIVVAIAAVTLSLARWASRASQDQLTGLRNRRGFDTALQELVAGSERTGTALSAVLMDLDHFKSINDRWGHAEGDRALRRLGSHWSDAVPHTAVLARHGGDEFALLLPGLNGDDALTLVRKTVQALPEPAVSCGIAQHRLGDSAAQLMRRADGALYNAKAAGRGRCVLWVDPQVERRTHEGVSPDAS